MIVRRLAAHRIYDKGLHYITNGILILEDGKICSLDHLEEEIPFTEWIGGVIVLSDRATLDDACRNMNSLADFCARMCPAIGSSNLSYAWHIDAVDLQLERILADCQITRLNGSCFDDGILHR